jgi:hypothetical protein
MPLAVRDERKNGIFVEESESYKPPTERKGEAHGTARALIAKYVI